LAAEAHWKDQGYCKPQVDPSPEAALGAAGHQSAHSNIPDRNPFFTGREQVLAQLQEALAGRGRAALNGLGGVGKTQTAVEYAHLHQEEYLYEFFASAQSREALVSGYTTIAGFLRLSLAEAQEQELVVNLVKHWLSSHQRWLLILDNADELTMAREFIPPGESGHVLLTTRAGAVGVVARCVDIREMKTEEGALFLLRRAKNIAEDAPLDAAAKADQETAKMIATQLDGLPLALDQAGAYIEETGCGLSHYLDLYRKRAPDLLQLRGTLGTGHSDPVATTWALSFENIKKANPAAAELLRFCAFLHPDAIPEELFSNASGELGSVLESLGSDAIALDRAISEIREYSLLRRDSTARTLQIHRLVQAVLKQEMDEATQRLWAERAVRAVNRTFPHVEFSTWAICERLLPQADACAELINHWRFEFREAAELLNRAGLYLYDRGRYADAKPLWDRTLAIFEKALGTEHPDVATSLNNLALLYRTQGQYAEAEPLHQRVQVIREKAFGPEHPDVATSLNNLALLYWDQGQYSKAEPLYKRALSIRERALGPGHLDVATILHNLAGLYWDQGHYGKAETFYKLALATREKCLGPEHPDVATTLNNLAGLYRVQRQYSKAEALFYQALGIREKALGPKHPDVATSLNNLALLHQSQYQYAKAEPFYERALSIRKEALGTEHPAVAAILHNLAELWQAQGEYVKAESLYQRALQIFERALGPEHPDVGTIANSFAGLYKIQGQYAKAEPLYRRALAIRENALGPEHPDVATSLNDLAALYAAQGQYAKAEPLYGRSLAIRENTLGPEHPDVV
jgi:tetratricopeptide (TPR) repeat protein